MLLNCCMTFNTVTRNLIYKNMKSISYRIMPFFPGKTSLVVEINSLRNAY